MTQIVSYIVAYATTYNDSVDLQKNDDVEDSEEEVEPSKMTKLQEEDSITAKSINRASRELQPTGKVVGVIKRNWRAYGVQLQFHTLRLTKDDSYVCHIDRTSLVNSNNDSLAVQIVFATPVSRLLPRIRVRTRQAPALVGQKILVTIDRWSVNSRYPEGHFVRALGQVESKEAEQESLLLEFEVPYRPFGKAILDCLPPEGDGWVVPPKDPSNPAWRDREDLRDLLICSIDPPSMYFLCFASSHLRVIDCQDIDDALHARILPNGNIEAGVRECLSQCSDFPYSVFARYRRCFIFRPSRKSHGHGGCRQIYDCIFGR